MKIFLKATLQHMADNEIRRMVSDQTLAKLKITDKHPQIRAYSIGHEGAAGGNLVGIGKASVQYFRDAIVKLFENVRNGIKVYHGHLADGNTTDDSKRPSIGKVVGRALKEIDGILHTVAAVYIRPEYQTLPLDVASIEADVIFGITPDGAAHVDTIERLTGIALGNSATDVPGFPGATLVGAFQAFTHSAEQTGERTMTKAELLKAIKDSGLQISDLFTSDELLTIPFVKDLNDKQKENYEHYRRVEKTLGEERTARDAELGKLRKDLTAAQGVPLLKTLATERKLTDIQTKFLERHLADFKTDAVEADALKRDANTFLDKIIKDSDELAAVFGVKPEDKGKSNGKSTRETKREDFSAGNTPSDEDNEDSLTNPEKNPFIPA